MASGKIFEIPIEVRFRDLDALGHVNNAVYMTYFEEGRKSFFMHQVEKGGVQGFNFILAHVNCDYRLPIVMTDQPMLQMWVEKMGTKSFTFGYRLADRKDREKVFATGQSVQVAFDYGKAETMDIPEAMKVILAPFHQLADAQ